MEHRFCRRRDVVIPSSIHIRDDSINQGTITNISFDGAYAQLSDSEHMAVDSVIRIEFSLFLDDKTGNIVTRMPALVVHCDGMGIGVMFLHDDIEFARQLKKAMKCAGRRYS
jgi:hypothetical protein